MFQSELSRCLPSAEELSCSDEDNRRYPTPSEWVKLEQQQVLLEIAKTEQAQAQVARLAAKLRALGIDPDEVELWIRSIAPAHLKEIAANKTRSLLRRASIALFRSAMMGWSEICLDRKIQTESDLACM
jgi:hypothetical protein